LEIDKEAVEEVEEEVEEVEEEVGRWKLKKLQ
jgi:hypothetical protein